VREQDSEGCLKGGGGGRAMNSGVVGAHSKLEVKDGVYCTFRSYNIVRCF
jgi:hypothetical protein